MEITRRVMSDENPVQFSGQIRDIWLLISVAQLATRHPEIGDHIIERVTHIAREMQKAIADRHPDAHELIEMGWDEQHDITRDTD